MTQVKTAVPSIKSWISEHEKWVPIKDEEIKGRKAAKHQYEKVIEEIKVLIMDGATEEFKQLLRNRGFDELDDAKKAVRYPSDDWSETSAEGMRENIYLHRIAAAIASALLGETPAGIAFPMGCQANKFKAELTRITVPFGISYSIDDDEVPFGMVRFHK